MITKEFRQRFKSSLGDKFNYSPPVKLILQDMGVKNRNGEPYSSQSIRNVFNGKRGNEAVEIAILQCYKNAIEQRYKLESLKKSLTNPPEGENQ